MCFNAGKKRRTSAGRAVTLAISTGLFATQRPVHGDAAPVERDRRRRAVRAAHRAERGYSTFGLPTRGLPPLIVRSGFCRLRRSPRPSTALMIAELRAMMLVISATYSPSCVASSDACPSGLELCELQGEQLERVLARLMRLEGAASGVEEPPASRSGLRGNKY